ncbi:MULTISPECIES: ATP-binding cassette domain-containing protein [Xenorhabdus]|uniref:Adhesion component ABC transporter ATP-binding protein n=1 Tax=Xenorhabdus stockiae TaxID=351614 RepID=A0A2D0KS82_9GAMM|nr:MULTISPECIES: ATP-binding cassette domain-containing protein [Xenorhabdus]MCC8367510.1 ATP-binding cassette domain-containing protein [Xenorhabdus sp. PB61.4]MCC8380814.1 ATP-binding cassette domain-containing protein [Xenorhabdus sp. PB30.3]PHM58830.1 adhesion component ABC transporter ATP-binding protein [Xenorhabdus sp. KK7.4]PHM66291.1 adhesion component ABC transporter ATP-binding protein [Xenorhabdus stockiae]PHM71982.1 adhesion component ABC transporter ATP-binding protein [Xenorhabd
MNLNQFKSIEVINISYGLTGNTVNYEMISDITFSIIPGEITLITGPKASTNSTLLSIASGMLQPDQGDVFINNNKLKLMSDSELGQFHSQSSGFIFQSFNLSSELTLLDNLLLSNSYGLSLSRELAVKIAQKSLDIVKLGDKSRYYPGELSENERQRAAMAKAIVKRPEYLFADEPTRHLNHQELKMFIDIFKFIAHEQKGTVVIASQDKRLIQYADSMITLESGKIVKTYESFQERRVMVS